MHQFKGKCCVLSVHPSHENFGHSITITPGEQLLCCIAHIFVWTIRNLGPDLKCQRRIFEFLLHVFAVPLTIQAAPSV